MSLLAKVIELREAEHRRFRILEPPRLMTFPEERWVCPVLDVKDSEIKQWTMPNSIYNCLTNLGGPPKLSRFATALCWFFDLEVRAEIEIELCTRAKVNRYRFKQYWHFFKRGTYELP